MTRLSADLTARIEAMAHQWMSVSDVLPVGEMPVLAWEGRHVLRAMHAGKFEVETRPGGEEESTEYSEELDSYFLAEGWYEMNEFDECHWMIEAPVTHWMKLPEPPQEVL